MSDKITVSGDTVYFNHYAVATIYRNQDYHVPATTIDNFLRDMTGADHALEIEELKDEHRAALEDLNDEIKALQAALDEERSCQHCGELLCPT